MSDASDSTRNDTLARLAQSRAEIRRVLEPPPRIHHNSADGIPDDGDEGGEFPRSRTMRLLLTGRGIGTVGAVVGGLLMSRPALAFRLLRMLPTGAVARMMIIKAISAIRSKQR